MTWKFSNSFQPQGSKQSWLHWLKAGTTTDYMLVLCFGLILLLMGVCTLSRKWQVERGSTEIRENLYVPTDAILLGEIKRDDALAYHRGCTGLLVEMVYGVNRPLAEIIEEYHLTLISSDWELNPGHTPNKTDLFASYQKGPTVELYIGSTPNSKSLYLKEQNKNLFTTIYVVSITYTTPSNAECTG